MKSLFDTARDIQHGVLESRMTARMETEGRKLTDRETVSECEYILETIDYSGYDTKYIGAIKRACKYIIGRYKKWEKQ